MECYWNGTKFCPECKIGLVQQNKRLDCYLNEWFCDNCKSKWSDGELKNQTKKPVKEKIEHPEPLKILGKPSKTFPVKCSNCSLYCVRIKMDNICSYCGFQNLPETSCNRCGQKTILKTKFVSYKKENLGVYNCEKCRINQISPMN